MRRPRTQWLVRAACVAAMVFTVSGCGSTPKLDFIQARPEKDLVYPGATILSTKTYPEDSLLGGGASIDREFTSGASTDDIIAWYRTELANRKWSGGVSGDSGTDSYAISAAWFYPGIWLDLEFHAPANGTMRYLMHISSAPEYDVSAQIQALRETPEVTLAPTSAQQPGAVSSWWDLWWSQKVPGTGGSLIRVEHNYVSDSTPSEIARYYETELAARGWKATSPPATDPRGAPPHRTWQKGTVTALFFVPGLVEHTYEFALDQTLDSAGSPVAP